MLFYVHRDRTDWNRVRVNQRIIVFYRLRPAYTEKEKISSWSYVPVVILFGLSKKKKKKSNPKTQHSERMRAGGRGMCVWVWEVLWGGAVGAHARVYVCMCARARSRQGREQGVC